MVLLGLSLVRPVFPGEQALQHTPTIVAIVYLAICARKQWLSTPAYACLIAMLWLHILGARYVYSFVPYDEWARMLLGTPLSEWFDWQRNHYDRLVHVCFGLLCIVPASEVATRYGQIRPRWALLCSLLAVMTISGLYEIFEWMIAVIMSPHNAEAYNGQQGDFWDAQKDMALALAGSLVSVSCIAFRIRQRDCAS